MLYLFYWVSSISFPGQPRLCSSSNTKTLQAHKVAVLRAKTCMTVTERVTLNFKQNGGYFLDVWTCVIHIHRSDKL